MEKYLMGIDNGGTVVKAVIFDFEGNEISSASKKMDVITPKPGFTERDMRALWRENIYVIRKAIVKSGLSGEQIVGVSCTGHGKGLYLWGNDNKPAYNGIISTDSRAWEIADNMHSDGTNSLVYEKTYQSILGCQPVALIKWFQQNDTKVIEKTKWIFSVKDYIRFMLTGEAFLEVTDYSGSSLMNISECRHDTDLLKVYGIEEIYPKLPPIRHSTEICGYIQKEVSELTGLKVGTPVSGGMFDIDACAVAMDITVEDRLCVIAGTWSINEYISKTPVTDLSIMMNSLFCIPGYYLIEECSPTSASNSEWFISKFMSEEATAAQDAGESVFDIVDRMIDSIAPEDSKIVFLPFLYGSNESDIAKASFVGISSYHTKAHILRAVYEGIVFSHKTHIDKLCKSNKQLKTIRLAGGAAKSPIWVQMFADVLNMPVEVIEINELGALGCAMSVGIAIGLYNDYQDAAEKMVKVRNRVMPDLKKHEIYKNKYRTYQNAVNALDGIWKELL